MRIEKSSRSFIVCLGILLVIGIDCKGRNIQFGGSSSDHSLSQYRIFEKTLPAFPDGDKVKFTIYMPLDWKIEDSMAGPIINPTTGDIEKRIEFGYNDYRKDIALGPAYVSLLPNTIKAMGEKIQKEIRLSDRYRIVVAENRNVEGESGDSAMIYAVTTVYVANSQDFFQEVSFYEAPKNPIRRNEILRMIDMMKIEIIRD